MKPNVNYIEIKDLAIASYLYATGEVQLVNKYRSPKGEVFFQFAPTEITQKLISEYWNLQAKPIQPKQLFSSMRDMRDMIHST